MSFETYRGATWATSTRSFTSYKLSPGRMTSTMPGPLNCTARDAASHSYCRLAVRATLASGILLLRRGAGAKRREQRTEYQKSHLTIKPHAYLLLLLVMQA